MAIRLATAADAAAVRAIYTPFVDSTVVSFEYEVPTTDQIRERIVSTLPTHPWLVAEQGGRVLGYAYAQRFSARAAYQWSVETSIYLAPAVHGQGRGRDLYSRLVALVAAQGYQQAFAGITLPNPASVALHESMGFVPVATYRRVGWKFGAWHDVGWWQRPLSSESSGEPGPPTPVDQLPPAALLWALSSPGG